MEATLRAFHRIVKRHTDLKWARSRDDLLSRTIKALRAFKEGKPLQEVLSNRELSFEIEDTLEELQSFAVSYGEETDRLINLLSLFIKSPAPCKIRLINFVEVLVEDRRVSEGKEV